METGKLNESMPALCCVLKKLAMEYPEKWFIYVDRLQFSLNASFNRAVKTMPFEILSPTFSSCCKSFASIILMKRETKDEAKYGRS